MALSRALGWIAVAALLLHILLSMRGK